MVLPGLREDAEIMVQLGGISKMEIAYYWLSRRQRAAKGSIEPSRSPNPESSKLADDITDGSYTEKKHNAALDECDEFLVM
jgi:hypothetical protein